MPGILVNIQPHTVIRVQEPKSKQDSALKDQAVTANHEALLPTPFECTIHLKLLQAICLLKLKVEQQYPQCSEVAWTRYLNLAVARFTLWVYHVRQNDYVFPPLDVLMVWHSFMLNPGAYARFERIVLNGCFKGRGIDWEVLDQAIDESTGAFMLNASQVESLHCANLNADLLAFLKDNASFFETVDRNTAETSTDRRTSILHTAYTTMKSTNFIYTPPSSSSPHFVFDLASAVNRQLKFATKMVSFNWLRSPYLSNTLASSITRYTKFFNLMATSPGNMLAPTLDIDLIWHTQQLSPSRYREYCLDVAGRFINHNDDITSEEAGRSFGNAAEVFEREFGGEYAVCLCWYCETAKYSRDGVEQCREMMKEAIEREVTRRKLEMGIEDMVLGRAGQTCCGEHARKCTFLEQKMRADCDGGCGSCNGECGNGGCGGCSNSQGCPQGTKGDCSGCGGCNGECGNGGCGGCSNFETEKKMLKGSDCSGCGSCNGECGNGGCGGCNGGTFEST